MSILIKNGLVYDGTECEPEEKDVEIRGDKIVHIGKDLKRNSHTVLDAKNALVMPGFIDIHGSPEKGDLPLLFLNEGKEYLKQGITTVIGGHAGISLAPLIHQNSLFAFLEKRHSGYVSGVNISWISFKGFIKTISARNLPFNFGSLIGYTSLRSGIASHEHDLTEREDSVLKRIIKTAFEEGALGISFNFGHFSPYQYSMGELERWTALAARHGKLCAFHMPHTPRHLLSIVRDLIRIDTHTGANMELNHLNPLQGEGKVYEEVKSMIESKTSSTRLNFDLVPNFSLEIPVTDFVEPFLEMYSKREFSRRLKNRKFRKEIIKTFPKIKSKGIRIGSVPRELIFLEGKSVQEFSAVRGCTAEEGICALMELTYLEATLLFDEGIDRSAFRSLASSPESILSVHGEGFHSGEKFSCLYGAREKTEMPLQKIISKLTSAPAKKYGIEKRGEIKKSYHADILIVRDGTIQSVLVNGNLVFHDGVFTGKSGGVVVS